VLLEGEPRLYKEDGMKSVRLALAASLGLLIIGGSAIPHEQERTYPDPGITTIDWTKPKHLKLKNVLTMKRTKTAYLRK